MTYKSLICLCLLMRKWIFYTNSGRFLEKRNFFGYLSPKKTWFRYNFLFFPLFSLLSLFLSFSLLFLIFLFEHPIYYFYLISK